MDLWEIERELISGGYNLVCGVDEAGRGPLAGPVCAAAIILPHGINIKELNDSKKLSNKKREELYNIIIQSAVCYGIAFASVEEIEKLNILNATFLAMNRAISKLNIKPELSLIDGNQSKGIEYNNKTVIGGDSKCASIAAASILAKVTRDRLMAKYDEIYPQYGFAKHKGYGTKEHRAAILEFGPCSLHRVSFLKKLYEGEQKWTENLSDALENRQPLIT